MFDRFLFPYYIFFFISTITLILVFFIPTNSKVKIKHDNYNFTKFYNNSYIKKNINIVENIKNQKINDNNTNLFFKIIYANNNLTKECINILNNKNKKSEIRKINILNTIIKITVIVLFALVVLNIAFVCCMLNSGACYDEDTGGFCQDWTHTFSYGQAEDYDDDYGLIYIIWIILFISSIFIVILSGLSIDYSRQFKNKVLDICNYKFNKDYIINNWNYSIVLLSIIFSLYLLEVLFCIYSMCYFLLAFDVKEEE